MRDYTETALNWLRNRGAVLWALEKLVGNFPALENIPQGILLTPELRQEYLPLKPILEAALQGKFPAKEELRAEVEWHYYPLEGVICHYVGNSYSFLENRFYRVCPEARRTTDSEFLKMVRQHFAKAVRFQID